VGLPLLAKRTLRLNAAKGWSPPSLPHAAPAGWRVLRSGEWPEDSHSGPPQYRAFVLKPQDSAVPVRRFGSSVSRHLRESAFPTFGTSD
jgi:hypothetical protein